MSTAREKRIDRALERAVKDAQADLRDHAKDPVEVRRFLAGVVDGMKRARFVAMTAND